MAVKKWFPYTHQILKVLRCAVTEWLDHRASSKGAALAFYTLFSLAPILVLVIAVAGFFYGEEAAQGQLLAELRGLLGAQGADTVQAILAGAQNKETGRFATIVATVLLIVGGDHLEDLFIAQVPVLFGYLAALQFLQSHGHCGALLIGSPAAMTDRHLAKCWINFVQCHPSQAGHEQQFAT